MNYTIYNRENYKEQKYSLEDIRDFLYDHLDEYGDEKEAIMNCIEYSLSDAEGKGGFMLIADDDEKITGAVVMNNSGMKGYIPENFLVYIAVHGDTRGKGVGKELMNRIIEQCEGDIALHVEEDNPAKFLYEKVGFTNPYLEMRYKQK